MFIAIWTSTTFVLVQSYAGSLTAMLANPQLQSQIKSLTALEELLRHDDISLIIEKGTLANFYMSTAASDTMINQLYKRATILPKSNTLLSGCNHTKITQCGNSAFILDSGAIMRLTSADFSATGKCNFYLIEERIMISTYAMAFQVRQWYLVVHITSTCSFIAERKPFSRRYQLFSWPRQSDGPAVYTSWCEGEGLYPEFHKMHQMAGCPSISQNCSQSNCQIG